MNIQHLALKRNNSLIECNETQPEASTNHTKTYSNLNGHELLEKIEQEFAKSAKTALSKKIANDNLIEVSAYNRLGSLSSFDISPGDIAIIGDNHIELTNMLHKIKSCFKSNNQEIEFLSPLTYSVDGLKSADSKYTNRVVLINTSNTLPAIIKNVVENCSTKIVFRMNELKLLYGLSCQYQDGDLSNNIISSLGGDFDTQKVLVATLDQGEFLVVSEDSEVIRSLYKNQNNQFN